LDETEFTLEFNVLDGAKGTAPVADVILGGASNFKVDQKDRLGLDLVLAALSFTQFDITVSTSTLDRNLTTLELTFIKIIHGTITSIGISNADERITLFHFYVEGTNTSVFEEAGHRVNIRGREVSNEQ
jgi:hypothetical protein